MDKKPKEDVQDTARELEGLEAVLRIIHLMLRGMGL